MSRRRLYQDYGGIVYEVVGYETDRNNEQWVLYRVAVSKIQNGGYSPHIWRVTLAEFESTITTHDGRKIPRFQRIA